jgi:hypothetical protein
LIHKLRLKDPQSDLAKRGLNYLCSKGLQGNPLREDAPLPESEALQPGQLDMSPAARLKDAESDVLRLHAEKMRFFERTIELEREVERYRKGMENWKATAEAKDRDFAANLEAARSASTPMPVAWIVQAKDAPLSPVYLQWNKVPVGLLREDQCNFTPLYGASVSSTAPISDEEINACLLELDMKCVHPIGAIDLIKAAPVMRRLLARSAIAPR